MRWQSPRATRRRSTAARAHRPTTGDRSRSPLRPATAPRSPAPSRTRSCSRACAWSSSGSGRRPRRPSSSTRTVRRRTTHQTVATADGDSASFVYPVSTPVTVGEVAVPAGYRAVIHCGLTREAPQPYGGGPFPVDAPATGDATLTCTITNIQLRSTVQVVKDWAGATSSATMFVDQDGVAPYDTSIAATASGDGTSFDYPVSTPVTLGETAVPTGFRAQIDCGAGPQPYAGGPFAVTSPAAEGTTLTCTVINTPTTTVRVIKNWSGRPDSATIFVDRLGQAPLDTFGVATTDGQFVSHDYPPSTQVTLGEIVVPTGYVAFINCGNGPQDLRRYTGGPLSVTSPSTPGGVLTCTLTNARQPSPGRLVIAKKASRNVLRAPGPRHVHRHRQEPRARHGAGRHRVRQPSARPDPGQSPRRAEGERPPLLADRSAGAGQEEDLRRDHSRGTRRPPSRVRERRHRRGREHRQLPPPSGRFEEAARAVQQSGPRGCARSEAWSARSARHVHGLDAWTSSGL